MAHLADDPTPAADAGTSHRDRATTSAAAIRSVRRAAAVLTCASLLACSGGGDAPQPPPGGQPASNPIADAYAALVGADESALPGVIAALDGAVGQRPDDGASTFYAGVMRLWRLTAARQDPARDLVQMALDAQATLALLERARTLRPESEHAAAFLGVAQVTIGHFVGDAERIDDGQRVLDEAVRLHPAYVNGVRAIALGALPRESPFFAEAIEALFATIAACGLEAGGVLGLTFAYPAGPLPSARRVCNDEGIVAHVWEGIFLTFGDILVKQGDAAKARALYENARSSPGFDTWLLRDLLEERIEQAPARAERYLDDDPANDPLTWMEEDRICVGCHASTD